ncbi:MAG: TraI/MobA(P) family conjugative relaxase [Shewanella sp.]
MIAKHVAKKGSAKSSFHRLVDYISDEQGKEHRVSLVRSTHCHAAGVDAAVAEVLATQQQNTRAKGDKTYHLLVSFREGETLDDDTLSKIEAELCEAIGFGEHQRISAVHCDTDNLHIHVAINKIHPQKLTMVEPFGDYRVLGEACDRLEDKYGLEKDNHISHVRSGQSRANDMEAHSGQKSLISWTREQCGEALKQAQSWNEVHQVLHEHGLRLQERANGLVITSDIDVSIKASSVSRELSKPALEKRLGDFVPAKTDGQKAQSPPEDNRRYRKQPIELKVDTTTLYRCYQQQASQSEQAVSQALALVATDKSRKLTALGLASKLKRFAISQEANVITRKLLYKHHFDSVKRQQQKIQQTAAMAKKQVYKESRQLTWADWLKQQAQQGDTEALRALQARQPHRYQQSNRLSGRAGLTPNSAVLAGADSITKKGSVIDKRSGVREVANAIVLPSKVTTANLINALTLAQARYGNVITVDGTDAFKRRVVNMAIKSRLDIQFTGDAEQYRQQLEERNHDNTRKDGRGVIGRGHDEPRRSVTRYDSNRRGDERASSELQRKSNLGSVGREPPPSRRNGLRDLSQLGVASFKGKGAMLLSGNVPGDVEQQRPRAVVDALRWGIFGARLSATQLMAAEKYIEERLSKREQGMDIAIHEPLTGAVKGRFAGVRRIDGESLLLVETAPGIVSVLPIKSDVKRLKIGDPININQQGKVSRTRGVER